MQSVDSDEGYRLDFDIKGTFHRISRFDPVGEGLVQSADPFAEVDRVAEPFDFGFEFDPLTNLLAVGEIVSQVYGILFVHSAGADGDNQIGPLGDGCGTWVHLQDLNA